MTKILIVDDQKNNLYLLQVLLSSNGYELESASNGAEALELALQATPDMIISDILMPVMDGFSLCRACKEDERLRDIPFIFYTATYTEPKDEALALSLGAERFLIKPAEPAQFLVLVKEIVEKYAAGKRVARHGAIKDADYYKEYNAALIRKLEDKVTELELKNREMEAEISARVKAEETLRESEERFRNAFENAPIGKALITLDGRFLRINRSFSDMLGYSEEELLKKTYQEITHPDDLAPQLAYTRQLLAGEIPSYQIEKRFFHKDRRVIGCLLHMSLVRDQTGQPSYFISQVQDITENKRMAVELHNLVDLLNITGQIAKIGGWEIIPETQKLNWTEEVYRIHEVDPATPINVADAINFYASESQPVISAAVQACIASGTPWDLDLRLITAKGKYIWVHTLGIAERCDGKISRIYGTFQDITERKLAEDEIRQQTTRAQALVRTANHINSKLDLNAVLSSVCEETARALTAPAVALHLYDQGSQTFSVVADYGLPAILREKSVQIPLNDYPPELSPTSNSAIIIQDTQVGQNIPNADLLRSMDCCTTTSVKIKNKETYIGFLSVYSIGKVRQFSDDEFALLEGLSNQAAQAITNANLFGSTVRRLKNIEALRTIDVAIANSLNIHMTLKVIADETIQQLGVDAANILLFEPASNLLESAVSQGFRTTAMQKVSLRIGEGIAGRIASDWERIFIPDMADYRCEFTHAPIFTGEDFVTYCGMPLRAKGQFIGVLEVFNRKRLNPDQDWFGFLETLAGQAAIAIDSIRSFEEVQLSNTKLILAYDATIEGWSRAMDLRDKETEGHTLRVTQLTVQLARNLGISNEQIVHLRRGALLHDMGKLGIPDRILLKPDKLTDEEWVIMRKHPQYAYDMLSSITYLRPALEIPYCHHEKWDGSGYPRGLKGEEIPLAARIFAVIDVWDALTSDRPYRKAWTQEQTFEYIREQVGRHFDPQVVKSFIVSGVKSAS